MYEKKYKIRIYYIIMEILSVDFISFTVVEAQLRPAVSICFRIT